MAEDVKSTCNLEDSMDELEKKIKLVFSICTLIAIFKGVWVIDLKIILPFVLGRVNLFESILFIAYEKVGA